MASKHKTRNTSNTHKKKVNKANQKKVRESGAVQDEIILVIALVISILLFLSFFDLSGKAGNFVSGIIFGLVGLEAYLIPFIIFFGTAFHISNLGNKRAGRKLLSAYVFFIALAALIQLISGTGNPEEVSLLSYYLESSKSRMGGGIIGGIFAKLLSGLFDTVGAVIILIAVMLICIIVISGKAILTLLASKSKKSMEERREYQRLRREQYGEEEYEERGFSSTGSGRRPPKTFVLDQDIQAPAKGQKEDIKAKDTVINLKERKAKKGQSLENMEPSFLNFHKLFDEKEEDTAGKAYDEEPELPVYEEELRRKFHQPEPEEDKNYDPVEVEEPIIAETTNPTGAVHEPVSASERPVMTTVVEENVSLDISQVAKEKEYIFPPLNLLSAPKQRLNKGGSPDKDLKETAMKLQSTLESFGVHVTITNVSRGPAVTRYELQPEQGVKVSRITSLADDIKLNLAASDVRIEAPIPGKAAVGIEVPNKENSMVSFREMIESREFQEHPSDIAFAVGKDIGGQTVITDIAKMPHLLIAGATGSGKSVCINTLIMSILYKAKPTDVRLIMVDPKVVELSVYNGIPHLLIPVVTDPKKASAALNWAVMEMTERYKKFADVGVRDLKGYNEKIKEVAYLNDENYQKLPQIVIIIDELADLMMVAPGEVEDAICRLAQMARAAGLHLIIATQRPSVNVITGLIKANVPSRIAFAVSSAIDSRTIIDGSGAEKLLGKGDMLFFPSGYPKPVRVQGAFISDKEVGAVVEFLKKNNSEAVYSDDVHEKINNAKAMESAMQSGGGDNRDEYFAEAGKFIIEKDKASIGMLQRVYKIGFNRAARIMDQLAEAGVVGPEEGTKPRKILMTLEEFERYLEEY